MWQDNQAALDDYAWHIASEMAHRGIPVPEWAPLNKLLVNPDYAYPRWFGNEAFHRSHRRNLLRKDYSWYSQFFGKETGDDVYAWPTKQPDGSWILRFKQVGAKKYQEHVEHFI
jgi:hypothetical protein